MVPKYFRLIPFILLLAACQRSAQTYLTRGDAYFAEGKYADAQLNYTKAIQKNSGFGEAYYKLGLVETKLDKGVPAYQALNKAVGLLPNDIRPKIALADVCFALYVNDRRRPETIYNKVAELATQILQKEPNSPDGFRLQGALKLLDRKPADAADLYRKANQLRPMDGDIVLGYTQALFQSGQQQEAEKLAFAFLEQNKSFAPLYDSFYGQLMSSNRVAEAENILKLWMEKNPKDATAVFRLAAHFAQLRKPAEMTAALQSVLNNPDNFPQGRMQVGDFYYGLRAWPEATAQYEQGAKADAKNAEAYRKKLIRTFLAQGKQQEALELLAEIIKQNPKDADARTIQARLWLDSGKPEKLEAALPELQAVLKDRPQDPVLLYDLGRAYVGKRDFAAARSSFVEAANRRKDFIPPRIELAKLAVSQQNPTEVLKYADEILALYPGEPQGRLFRVWGLRATGNPAEARSQLKLLLKDYPRYRDAQLQLGLLAIDEKKFKEAEDIFRKISEVQSDDSRAAVALAGTYSLQNQYDRAIQTLIDESKRTPGNSAIDNVLASTAVRAGKYSLAIERFQRVVNAKPQSAEAHVNLAEAYRVSGDTSKAIVALNKAKQLNPNDQAVLMTLATALYNVGQLEDSRETLRQYVRVEKGNSKALNNLAFLIVETGGSLDEAQKLAEEAVRKDGKDLHAQDTLGWVYLKKKSVDSALQIFQRLVEAAPGDASYRYHLGAALAMKGDKEKARTALNAALARKPSPSEVKRIEALLAGLG